MIRDPKVLEQWVIYTKTRDLPNVPFVVRKWRIEAGNPNPRPSRAHQEAKTLDEARDLVPGGLFRIPRQPGDDPCIVEVWT